MLPPKLLRRVVLIPLLLVAAIVFVLLSPLLALLAAIASPFLGNWRPLRLLWITVSYAVRDVVAVVVLAFLWLAAGFGRSLESPHMQRAHYRIVGWFLRGLCRDSLRAVKAWVHVAEEGDAGRVLAERRVPVLVFSRHAGAGDSFLLVHELLSRYGRRPRIVMKSLLQLDPFVDLFGNRLANCFVAGGGSALIEGISRLASGLDEDGALLIFPEGGNFTEGRRQRTIERLEREGHHEAAERARRMDNLLAPRPGGALAALDGAPEADVVFVAHVGLPDPRSTGDMLRLVPIERPVRIGVWHVRRADVPDDTDERIDWLFAWWCRLDAWVERRGGERAQSATPMVTPEPSST